MMSMAFDPEWAAPADWAIAYRSLLLSAVPAVISANGKKKHPVGGWKEFQYDLTPQVVFDRWYGANGTNVRDTQMGFLTGPASLGKGFALLVIDIDVKDGKPGLETWQAWLEEHNNGIEFETWAARTGSNGRHLYFRYPAGVVIRNTQEQFRGIDTRAEGGFIVCPPSQHYLPGKTYVWEEGCAPWEIKISDAPEWLTDIAVSIGDASFAKGGTRTETETPDFVTDAFGNQIDGRDKLMADLAYARAIDTRRQCPIKPALTEIRTIAEELYETYKAKVKSRLPGAPDTLDARLEQEGRGLSALLDKVGRHFRGWDKHLREAALNPPGDLVAKRKEEASKGFQKARDWLLNMAGLWDAAGRSADAAAARQAAEVQQVRTEHAKAEEASAAGPNGNLLLSAKEFVAGFTPPEYLIDGMVQRGYLYSLTAMTGHGKTAVDMFVGQCIARGVKMRNREVEQGAVLFCAGENPDDIRARFLVLAEKMGFGVDAIPFHFINGIVDIEQSLARIRGEAEFIKNLKLVIVDTAAAYFRGDDGNNNVQQGSFARVLRQLTFLPGKPAVIVNCHPTKSATKENLVPVGGGAFLNEVDGNLTLWKNSEETTELHWQGKFRGPEFEPITFKLETVTSDAVKDAKGRHMPSVIASPIGELEIEMAEQASETEENVILSIVASFPNRSQRDLAKRAGWFEKSGAPAQSKVRRILRRMSLEKLVTESRKKYRITPKGRREIGLDDDG